MFKLFSAMTLFGLVTISAAFAQSPQPIQARVPFAFRMQNKTLPAGKYELTYNNSTLFIRGVGQNPKGTFAIAEPTTADSEFATDPGRLVFDCYGTACYLAQVWQGGVGGNRGLRVLYTRHERVLPLMTRVVSLGIPAK